MLDFERFGGPNVTSMSPEGVVDHRRSNKMLVLRLRVPTGVRVQFCFRIEQGHIRSSGTGLLPIAVPAVSRATPVPELALVR